MALQGQVFVAFLGESTLRPQTTELGEGASELGMGTAGLPQHLPLDGLGKSLPPSGCKVEKQFQGL